MNVPIFIVGAPRSGSTLLRMMLNAHSQVAMPHECSVIYRTMHRYPNPNIPVRDLAAFSSHLLNTPRFTVVFNLDGQTVLDALQTCPNPTPPALLGAVYRCSQGYLAHDSNVQWGDKYIGLGEFIPQLVAYFKSAKFIHIVRDALDSVASIKSKFRVYPSLSGKVYLCQQTVGAAMLWRNMTRASASMAQALGPDRYHYLHYEDLVTDPKRACADLCDFLDIRYEPTMLEYHKQAQNQKVLPADSFAQLHQNTARPPMKSRIGYGKAQLSSHDIKIVGYVCGHLMRDCQYSRICTPTFNKPLWSILIYRIVQFPYALWFTAKAFARFVLQRLG